MHSLIYTLPPPHPLLTPSSPQLLILPPYYLELDSIYICGHLMRLFSFKESSILIIKYVFSFLVFKLCRSSLQVILEAFYRSVKLCKLGLYITAYFGHGQCFIWEFLVLAFRETARLNTTFSNFSWSEILVCKLSMSSL